MTDVVLDDQAVMFLAQRSRYARELLDRLRADWPARLLAPNLVTIPLADHLEAFLRSVVIVEDIPRSLAVDAARILYRARQEPADMLAKMPWTTTDLLNVAYAQGRTLVTGHETAAVLARFAHGVAVVAV